MLTFLLSSTRARGHTPSPLEHCLLPMLDDVKRLLCFPLSLPPSLSLSPAFKYVYLCVNAQWEDIHSNTG